MGNKGLFGTLFKFIGILLISGIFYLLLFNMLDMTNKDGDMSQTLDFVWLALTVITAFIIFTVWQINSVARLRQRLLKEKASLTAVRKRKENLLESANELISKNIRVEEDNLKINQTKDSDTGSNVDRINDTNLLGRKRISGGTKDKIKDFSEFKYFARNYRNSEANVWISDLLDKMEKCEDEILHQTLTMNISISEYNTLIFSFPIIFLRGTMGLIEEKYIEEPETTERRLDF